MSDWISSTEAAKLIGVSRTTLYRTLADADERAKVWGAENEGWRRKPLVRNRVIYQVSAARAKQIAENGQLAAD